MNKITLDKFNKYHSDIGEDFMDQNCYIFDRDLFEKWIIDKYTKHIENLNKIFDDKDWDYSELIELYIDSASGGDYDDTVLSDQGIDVFYFEICEFANQHKLSQDAVNKVLYGDD